MNKSEYYKVSVEEEYKRDGKLNKNDVDKINNWMEKQPHLPPLCENQIIIFLRACGYEAQYAKEVIELNSSMRVALPQFFSNRDVQSEKLKTAMKYCQVGIMPDRDPVTGCTVFALKMLPIEVKHWDFRNLIKFFFMVLDITSALEGSSPGFIAILDFHNLAFSHLFRIPLGDTKEVVKYIEEASANMLKITHYVHGSLVLRKLLDFIKRLLKPTSQEHFVVHTKNDTLVSSLDPKCVPSDYGGTGMSIAEINEVMKRNIRDYRDWFLQDEALRQNVALQTIKL